MTLASRAGPERAGRPNEALQPTGPALRRSGLSCLFGRPGGWTGAFGRAGDTAKG